MQESIGTKFLLVVVAILLAIIIGVAAAIMARTRRVDLVTTVEHGVGVFAISLTIVIATLSAIGLLG